MISPNSFEKSPFSNLDRLEAFQRIDVVVSSIASQEGSWYESELACSPRACVSSPWVLWLPLTAHEHACQVHL